MVQPTRWGVLCACLCVWSGCAASRPALVATPPASGLVCPAPDLRAAMAAAAPAPVEPRVRARVRVGFNPIGVAVSPDGQYVYVANSGDNSVSKLSASQLKVVQTIPLASSPVWIALAPNSGLICVTARDDHELILLDQKTDFQVATIDLPYSPEQVVVDAARDIAYLSSNTSFLMVVDLRARRVVQTLSLIGQSTGLALSPDGKLLIVCLSSDNYNIMLISTEDRSVIGRTTAGSVPYSVAVDPNGVYAYVANQYSNDVTLIHLASQHPVLAIPVGRTPMDLQVTPSGRYLFVTLQQDNQVAIVDTVAHAVVGRVDLGISPWGLAFSPDGVTAYVANYELSNRPRGGGSARLDTSFGTSATQRVNNNTLVVLDTGRYR